MNTIYRWPSIAEWKRWSRTVKLIRARELVAQADRQRSVIYQADSTEAQTRARKLLREAEATPEDVDA